MLGGTLTCSRIQIDMLGFIVGDSDIDGKDPLLGFRHCWKDQVRTCSGAH
jgi:hypothetical protein